MNIHLTELVKGEVFRLLYSVQSEIMNCLLELDNSIDFVKLASSDSCGHWVTARILKLMRGVEI